MLETFAHWLTENILKLIPESRLTESLNFFIADTIKIYLLIILVMTIIAFIRTFLPPHKIKEVLSRQRFGIGNLVAALIGAVTPFCSCSSIPIFLGFVEAEVPLGITFSFLITSPLVNEVAFVLMGGTFGWTVAVLYAVSGIALGTVAGIIMGRLNLEKNIILNKNQARENVTVKPELKSLKEKIFHALRQAKNTFKNLWWIILISVAVGAAIHGYVPDKFFTDYLNVKSLWAVPIATLIGVPVYAACSTVVPIAFAAVTKGVPLGTALAFMMAIAGLSLPAAIILKKAMTLRLLLIFFGIVAAGIIIIGYLFNFIPI
ncbi:MAG: permease [Patescibacteria group bacterium]